MSKSNLIPAELEKRAQRLRISLDKIRSELGESADWASNLHAYAVDINNHNLIPQGFDIEDIGATGLQVVYDPSEFDSYHCIACRGLDISDSVSSDIERQAIEVVLEAYNKRHTPGPIELFTREII